MKRRYMNEPTLSWVYGDSLFFPEFYPSVKDGKVFCENWDNNGLVILDLHTGKEIWHGEGTVSAPPVLDCGNVFFSSGITNHFRLVCLSLETKEPLWITKAPGSPTSSPLVVNDKIITTTGSIFTVVGKEPVNENYMMCFNKITGEYLWKFEAGGKMNSMPAASGELVFASSEDGNLYALNTEGKLLWKVETGCTVHVSTSPVVYKDLIFYSCGDLYCLKTDGTLLWKMDLDLSGDISMSRGMLLGRNNGDIVSIDIEKREVLWRFPVGREISTTAVSGSASLFFGTSQGNICCLSREGELLWKYQVSDYFLNYAKPVLSEGYLLLVSRYGKLYAFELPAEYSYREAEGLFGEGKYQEALGFYAKALEYYEGVDDEEMVKEITQRISLATSQEIQCMEWVSSEKGGDSLFILCTAVLACGVLAAVRKRR
ncbi:MAG: PQQ-binding-like beta-propeller repeat protein [Theionarchaea archaeon]|nr:PQQ-binding-like beta-propeller repeat protein [Theionarchaea archaeon]